MSLTWQSMARMRVVLLMMMRCRVTRVGSSMSLMLVLILLVTVVHTTLKNMCDNLRRTIPIHVALGIVISHISLKAVVAISCVLDCPLSAIRVSNLVKANLEAKKRLFYVCSSLNNTFKWLTTSF